MPRKTLEELRNEMLEIVREKGIVTIEELSNEMGYRLHYFAYSLLPSLLTNTKCVEIIEWKKKTPQRLKWVC